MSDALPLVLFFSSLGFAFGLAGFLGGLAALCKAKENERILDEMQEEA